jgi:ubiquitin carboxyl-terminal hydrolase 34
MISMVRNDNSHLTHNKHIFSQEYCTLMWKVASMPFSLPADKASGSADARLQTDTELRLSASQLAASFVLETLVHARDRSQLTMWIDFLREQISADNRLGCWFAERIADPDCLWAQKLFLQSPVPEARAAAVAIYIQVFRHARPTRGSYNDQADGPAANVVKFMSSYVGLLPCAHRYWPNLMHYFQLLFEFASLGHAECEELLRQQLVSPQCRSRRPPCHRSSCEVACNLLM